MQSPKSPLHKKALSLPPSLPPMSPHMPTPICLRRSLCVLLALSSIPYAYFAGPPLSHLFTLFFCGAGLSLVVDPSDRTRGLCSEPLCQDCCGPHWSPLAPPCFSESSWCCWSLLWGIFPAPVRGLRPPLGPWWVSTGVLLWWCGWQKETSLHMKWLRKILLPSDLYLAALIHRLKIPSTENPCKNFHALALTSAKIMYYPPPSTAMSPACRQTPALPPVPPVLPPPPNSFGQSNPQRFVPRCEVQDSRDSGC